MAVRQEFIDYVLDQLSDFGEVTPKKMFGAVAFYKDELIFGMIGDDLLRLKADEINQPDFEARGKTAYFPYNDERSMPYWEVPEDVLEDRTELAKWAAKALDAARRKKATQKKRKKKK